MIFDRNFMTLGRALVSVGEILLTPEMILAIWGRMSVSWA